MCDQRFKVDICQKCTGECTVNITRFTKDNSVNERFHCNGKPPIILAETKSMNKYFLIIDLEATCWDRNTPEGQKNENEIIEIGAVLVCVSDIFSFVTHTFSQFVKPTINPILSDFCKNLTNITQDDVDKAGNLSSALENLDNEIFSVCNKHLSDVIFCSWGYYDQKQFAKDCRRQNIVYPFTNHISLKHEFAKKRNIKPTGVIQYLNLLGMTFEGSHHRGIDDAINIARIFIKEYE